MSENRSNDVTLNA